MRKQQNVIRNVKIIQRLLVFYAAISFFVPLLLFDAAIGFVLILLLLLLLSDFPLGKRSSEIVRFKRLETSIK